MQSCLRTTNSHNETIGQSPGQLDSRGFKHLLPQSPMAGFLAHPPHHTHSSKRIAPSHALSILSSYLEAASAKAFYHPDAILTANGPITPATGAQNMGLVLHNLKRVEAGLKGEQLGADLDYEQYGGQGLPGLMPIPNGKPNGLADGIEGASGNANAADEGWQDKMEFDRQQDIVQGEIGDRDNAVGERRDAQSVPMVAPTQSTGDKEERKRRKAERRLQERKNAEAKRKRDRDAEAEG